MSREIITPDNALVKHRGKWLSVHVGTYHDAVTMALARKRAGRITSVRDITRTQYGRVTDCMEIYVRGRVWKAVNLLLSDGIPAYPIYESGGHHKVIGIKVVTRYTAKDEEALEEYMKAAIARRDIAEVKITLVRAAMAKLRSQLTNGE